MTNSKSLPGSRAWGPEPSQQSKREHLLRVVRKGWGNDRKQIQLCHWRNFRNHACSQEEQMYQDTLQGDECLHKDLTEHPAPCRLPAKEQHLPCQERVVLLLQTESRAVGSHHLNCFQGPKWLGCRARGCAPFTAEALKGLPSFPLPQPLGEVLADGQEGVGSVLGIGDNLVKPSHFLPSEERKITHQLSKCLM